MMKDIVRLALMVIIFVLPQTISSVPLISKEKWGCENTPLRNHCIGWGGYEGVCRLNETGKKHCQRPTGVITWRGFDL